MRPISATQRLVDGLRFRCRELEDDPDHHLRYLLASAAIAIECLSGLHGGQSVALSPTDGASPDPDKGQAPQTRIP